MASRRFPVTSCAATVPAALRSSLYRILDFLGGLQHLRLCRFGGVDCVVYLARGPRPVPRRGAGHLEPHLGDGLPHRDEMAQQLLLPARGPQHRHLQLGEGLEQHPGIRCPVPPRVF
jgi:hypothetical protein